MQLAEERGKPIRDMVIHRLHVDPVAAGVGVCAELLGHLFPGTDDRAEALLDRGFGQAESLCPPGAGQPGLCSVRTDLHKGDPLTGIPARVSRASLTLAASLAWS